MKLKRYCPVPVRRAYIPKGKDDKRPQEYPNMKIKWYKGVYLKS